MVRTPGYRLHRPSGRAVVTLNGKDHYLGVHGSAESQAAYKRLIAEYRSSGKRLCYGVGANQSTVAMLICDYRDWAQENQPPKEYDQICYAIKHLDDYHDVKLVEFGPLKLKAVMDAMVNKVGQHGRPLSRKYINKCIDRIRQMFKWGAANEIIDVSIYQALMTVSRLKIGRTKAPDLDPVTPVDDDIVDETLEHCSPVLAAMIELQRATGMRPAEVCKLTPGMIDRSSDVWVATLTKHKTAHRGKQRTIFIGPTGQSVLRPYLLRAADQPCFSPSESLAWIRQQRHERRTTAHGQGNNLGTNVKRCPKWQASDTYSTTTYRRAIGYAIKKAFPLLKNPSKEEQAEWKAKYHWGPNQLRHNAATRVRKKFGIEGAQVILGHSRLTTTQVYAEINKERGVEIAKVIG